MTPGSWVRPPLGGEGEIGMNMAGLETAEGCLVLDAWLSFPVLRLTHGRGHHAGALPSLLREFPVPVCGAPLSLAPARARLRGRGLETRAELRHLTPDDRLQLASFRRQFMCVRHSILDGVAVAARTPAGVSVRTGDIASPRGAVRPAATTARLAALGWRSRLRPFGAGRDDPTCELVRSLADARQAREAGGGRPCGAGRGPWRGGDRRNRLVGR